MPEQAIMPRFIPKIGFSAGLNNLSLEEGYFIVTLDDKQLYVDAKLEDANTGQWITTRVPLGGYTTIWGNVNEKPFEEIVEYIYKAKKVGKDTKKEEQKIERMIYDIL